jgi:hypothetical protein
VWGGKQLGVVVAHVARWFELHGHAKLDVRVWGRRRNGEELDVVVTHVTRWFDLVVLISTE